MDVFKFFEDFLKIPRKSGNEKAISDYLVNFAEDRCLEYYRDSSNNVVIKKKSNRDSKVTVALQGHTDMVCTSINNYDFTNKGIDWCIKDGFYIANGTTLGADNGIGCALILSVLNDDNISIPNIEAIFTTSEETNMNGTKRLDFSKITADYLISLDGTKEGVIEVSSAGMVSFDIVKEIMLDDNIFSTYKIVISGLKGGHSGIDIDKKRGNAIEILFELLEQLNDYNLVSIKSGSQYNVIPNYCECIISSKKAPQFKYDNFSIYKDIKIEIQKIKNCKKIVEKNNLNDLVEFMHIIPKGVISYNENYPQTSVNIAAVETSYKHVTIKISIRSSNKKEEKKIVNFVRKNLPKNFLFKIIDEIPSFSYNKTSKLRNLLSQKYLELYNKKVVHNHIHAGVECGVFSKKNPSMDICIISPNIYGIHTVDEKLEIESVKRVYKWLIETLKCI